MNSQKNFTRRNFIKRCTSDVALVFFGSQVLESPLSSEGSDSNQKHKIGIIGCGETAFSGFRRSIEATNLSTLKLYGRGAFT